MPHCLGSGLSSRLSLSGHGSLQLDGKTGILAAKQNNGSSALSFPAFSKRCGQLLCYSHFYSFNLDAPSCGGVVKNGLHGSGYALAVA